MSTYDFELTMTGLVTLILPDSDRPAGPVDACLVDTEYAEWHDPHHHMIVHRPVLAVYARDIHRDSELGGERDLIVTPDGEELVNLDIRQRDLEFRVPGATDGPFEMIWAKTTAGATAESTVDPESPAMNWVPSLAALGVDDFQPANITSRISGLPPGRFEAADIALRDKSPHEPLPYSLPAETGPEPFVPIANKILLKSKILEHPIGEPTQPLPFEIILRNREDPTQSELLRLATSPCRPLRLALAHLPPVLVGADRYDDSTHVHHLRWLARLSADPEHARSQIHVPQPEGSGATIQGKICPSTRNR